MDVDHSRGWSTKPVFVIKLSPDFGGFLGDLEVLTVFFVSI